MSGWGRGMSGKGKQKEKTGLKVIKIKQDNLIEKMFTQLDVHEHLLIVKSPNNTKLNRSKGKRC